MKCATDSGYCVFGPEYTSSLSEGAISTQEDIQQKCVRKRDYPFDDGRVAKYGQPKERTNETLDCASEAKIWKVSYPPRATSVGQRHQCLVCKLENERCAGAALSSEGSFRSRDIQCVPRSLRAVMLGFPFYGSRRRPV